MSFTDARMLYIVVMQGVPIRIELGPRDMDRGELVAVRRDTSAKMTLKIDSAVDSVTQLLDDIHNSMYTKYDRHFLYCSHTR